MLDNQFKDSLKALETTLKILPKYQRKSCKNCEYILVCAGECDKTIRGDNNE